MKNVLIITYYWPPSGGAGVQRWVKFAKYLSRMGVEVFVLSVDPKYATYPQTDESLLKDIPKNVTVFHTKSFELYSLYKKFSSNKEVPYGGFANTKELNLKEKILRFARGNFFIPDPRKGWNRYAFAKAKEIIAEKNIDTLITTSPPHSTQLIGLKLKKQLKVNWIADFRDPWTDIYYYKDLYPTKLATTINKNWERKIFRTADKIITVSNDLKRLFSAKSENVESKIEVIPNGFDLDDFENFSPEKSEYFYISYVGTISTDYKIDGFIEAIQNLPAEIKAKVRIRFIGQMVPEHLTRFEKAGLKEMIEIIGYVKHSEAIKYLFSSNVLLLIIPDVENNAGIVTGKLFEYLASSRPILFIGPEDGDAAKIIADSKSGAICSYTDSEKIREALIRFYRVNNNSMVRNERNPATLKYSRENLTKQLLEIL